MPQEPGRGSALLPVFNRDGLQPCIKEARALQTKSVTSRGGSSYEKERERSRGSYKGRRTEDLPFECILEKQSKDSGQALHCATGLARPTVFHSTLVSWADTAQRSYVGILFREFWPQKVIIFIISSLKITLLDSVSHRPPPVALLANGRPVQELKCGRLRLPTAVLHEMLE